MSFFEISKIDPSTFQDLPEDIQLDIINDNRQIVRSQLQRRRLAGNLQSNQIINTAAGANSNLEIKIDENQEFLNTLDPVLRREVQRDLIADGRRNNIQRERPGQGAGASNPAVPGSNINYENQNFLNGLDSETRLEILRDAEPEFLLTLRPETQREAQRLRDQRDAQRLRDPMSMLFQNFMRPLPGLSNLINESSDDDEEH